MVPHFRPEPRPKTLFIPSADSIAFRAPDWNRMMNALAGTTSPYLALHKDNPVAWRLWGPEAFEEAQAANKPVFLSTGYTGCHWCHVMNAESFSDAETAAFLNENFIPVLVDREQRPDVDYIYQAAAGIMGHVGGWPLSMFLTPEGKPYFAGGFLPREERLGQPALLRVLTDMAALYRDRAEDVARNSEAIFQQLDNLYNREMRAPIDSIQLDVAAMRVGQRFDIFMGGLTGTMKFPNLTLLEVLWRAFLRTGAPQYSQLVSGATDAMLLGGLYDHVGGGFFRYSTDERWLVPHFEKMLSDNAQFIGFLTGLWQFNRNEICRQRVAETVEWLMREMRFDNGAFAAALDADSEGEDGKFYLWSEAEIDAALAGTFSARFKQVYGVRNEGNVPGGRNILRRLGHGPVPTVTDADEALLARQRQLLLAARDKRVRPRRDDQLLTDWNGLAVKALAVAGSAFDKPEWIEAAVTAFDAVTGLMGEGDLLYHSWAGGQHGERGFSDDYAHMAAAALQLYESTGQARFLDAARRWVKTLDANFRDEARGGYFFTAYDSAPLIVRTRQLYDQPAPSGNSTMLSVLTKLALITGEGDYGMRVQQILTAFAGEVNRAVISCGEYVNGLECFASGLQLVVVGPKGHPRTQELVRAIWGKALPNRLILQVEDTASLPPGHPAFGKAMLNGQATVYICQRNTCSQPIASAVTLSQALTLPPQRAAGAA